MDIKEIQELIKFVAKSGVDEVTIERDGFKLGIKKNPVNVVASSQSLVPVTIPQPQEIKTTSEPKTATTAVISDSTSNKPVTSENFKTVKSPMIGTFYRSASPGAPPFINVGDSIQKGKVVCVIEAMKLFNEIESEFSGKILKILVENASPVEYDQPLFLIDPAG
ncbi:MAG: acetyl-CoA carboxylase, biotin carboxyl carrier protein [Bacteroidetes bacterium RIFCSPLOWO2_02_FULL_36_8]|nr:MAG: acetyl-CoA carboxylase, biotin carboxyl carrier protein [Bacteroidetes bacterium RIFCSPLOWO2_02_FULL_36_8]OFY68903.1 MAG: acetyl-CoA carboxylase, biotin carboxyl carrier protein [Bacteroidetes bacterium RIFCSPLOWO2_12_FULL_37_12]